MDFEVTTPAIEEQRAKIERVYDEISAINENRITGDADAKLDELSNLTIHLEEMVGAELLARQKQQSPEQAYANASVDDEE